MNLGFKLPSAKVLGAPDQHLRDALQPGSLAVDSIGYFLSKLIPGVVGFMSVPVFIRIIGLEEYGQLAVLLPILLAFAFAGSGWLTQGILRFHPTPDSSPDQQAHFERTLELGAFVSLFATGLAVVILLAFLHIRFSAKIAGFGFCCCVLAYTLLLAKIQAELRPTSVLKRETLRTTIGFVLSILLIKVTGSRRFEWVLLGLAAGYLLPITFHIRLRYLVYSHQDMVRIVPTLRRLWRFGWPVGIWLLVSQLLPVIDRSVIQHIYGFSKAGIYASLYDISVKSFSLLAFPLTQAAHPRIMRYCNDGSYLRAYQIIKQSIKYQVIIFIPVIILTFILSRTFVHIILGFDDKAASMVLPLLTIAGFIWQVSLLVHKPLEMKGQTKLMLLTIIVVAVLEFVFSCLLVPYFGYVSAAYVVLGCSLLYLIVSAFIGYSKEIKAVDSQLRDPVETHA